MPDCVGVLKYGLYSVRPALPESRSFQMPESHRGPTLKHRPQHRAEDTESLERLSQQISIKGEECKGATCTCHASDPGSNPGPDERLGSYRMQGTLRICARQFPDLPG
eukprot:jgi/Chrzof1/5493/Cz16g05100.t1